MIGVVIAGLTLSALSVGLTGTPVPYVPPLAGAALLVGVAALGMTAISGSDPPGLAGQPARPSPSASERRQALHHPTHRDRVHHRRIGAAMSNAVLSMSTSLDGFVAGPNVGPGNGLGDGGHRLHRWFLTVPTPVIREPPTLWRA